MEKLEAKKRIEKLKKLITYHRYLYHVLDKQDISDAALDSLKNELFQLEQKYPEYIALDSPTQRVGGKPLQKFEKVRHLIPMLSFNDAFSEQEMEDWQGRIRKLLTNEEKKSVDYFCELKIDGLAIELVYKKGVLYRGSTRGDGRVGEDITQNLRTIEAIPLKLREESGLKKLPDTITVRGEVFLPKKEFDRLNKERKRKRLELFANPRNVAAGSVRKLDPNVTLKRRLDSYSYGIVTDLGQKTHEQEHQILKNLGLKTNLNNQYCKNLSEVFEFHKEWQKKREKLGYEIDGIVVMVNSNKIFEKLGIVGKAPRGSVAFKFVLKQTTTKIEDIKVQVGRTGALTPVAYLTPVRVGGVTISRATLHNEDEIKKLGVKIGDTVIVGRAGDVIPDIIRVLPELRTGREKAFLMPEKCPVCGQRAIKSKGGAVLRCKNNQCLARLKKHFYHFVSKGAFNIVGLGPKIIYRLIEEGLVSDPADLFTLKQGDLDHLERFAEKSAENLVLAVQSRKKIPFSRFIYSLGIRNVGEETATDLAENFSNLNNLKNAKLEDLDSITDIGNIVAESIYSWFHEKKNLEFLEKLDKIGVEIQTETKKKNIKLKGQTFVLTGGLESMTRDRVKEKIRDLGGNVSESVSQKTDYVVVGEDPGSNLGKARKLGIKMLNEKEFLQMIK
ncbi:NAD-dependent DNA ligase LigA [Patescibacteria group bacterium]